MYLTDLFMDHCDLWFLIIVALYAMNKHYKATMVIKPPVTHFFIQSYHGP